MADGEEDEYEVNFEFGVCKILDQSPLQLL